MKGLSQKASAAFAAVAAAMIVGTGCSASRGWGGIGDTTARWLTGQNCKTYTMAFQSNRLVPLPDGSGYVREAGAVDEKATTYCFGRSSNALPEEGYKILGTIPRGR